MRSKKTIKLALLIAFILIVPTLFFNFIGAQPMLEQELASDQIAIVNEDQGSDFNETNYQFGTDISTIIAENSEYDWVIESRSAALNGLENGQYDAIVYLDSSLTRNVLSFKEDEPTRGSIQYEVQPNLEAKNQEKVQKELESAKSKINTQVSKLYWQVVSEEVADVRTKFDNILEREKDFQNAMYSFYTPVSSNLTDEINRQKEVIEQVIDMTNSAQEESNQSINEREGVDQEIQSFLDDVDAFREYQEEQNELLFTTMQANQEMVNTGASEYEEGVQSGLRSVIEIQSPLEVEEVDQGDIMERILGIQQRSEQNNLMVENSYDSIMNTLAGVDIQSLTDEQWNILKTYKAQADTKQLDAQQNKLEEQRRVLRQPPSEGTIEEPEMPEEWEPDIEGGKLEDLQKSIEEIKGYVNDLKPGKDTVPDDDGNQDDPSEPGENDPENPSDNPDPEPSNPGPAPQPEPTPEPETPSDDQEQEEVETPEPEGDENTQEEGLTEEEKSEEVAMVLTTLLSSNTDQPDVLNVNFKNEKDRLDLWKKTMKAIDRHAELIKETEEGLVEEADQYNDLLGSYQVLVAWVIERLEQPEFENEQQLIEKIKAKEDGIKESGLIPEGRVNYVISIFNQTINSNNLTDLTQYYAELVSFENILRELQGSNEGIMGQIIDQQEGIDNIEGSIIRLEESVEDIPEVEADLVTTAEDAEIAQADFNQYVEQTLAMISNYEELVATEQELMADEINQLSESSNGFTSQLNEDMEEVEVTQSPDQATGEFLLANQSSTLSNLESISSTVDSIAERQSNVVGYTDELRDRVGSVQDQADALNSDWAQNVDTTELVQGDVYDILQNTMVDGQHNDYVYSYLANPVQVSGETLGERSTNTPPIIMLVIVMLSSLLIGFLLHQYSQIKMALNITLLLVLNLIAGLIISIYGLNIYSMNDSQSIQWTVFTILLLLVASSLAKLAFDIGSFTGWIVSLAMVLFFISPLLDMAMPNFGVDHPIASVYMSIQFGSSSQFYPAVVLLGVLAVLFISFPYILQHIKGSGNNEANPKEA